MRLWMPRENLWQPKARSWSSGMLPSAPTARDRCTRGSVLPGKGPPCPLLTKAPASLPSCVN